MEDFLINIEQLSKEDRLYLVGLIFMLGYQRKYVHIPVSYESIENCKYVLFDNIDSKTYHVSSSCSRETRLCHPKDSRLIITLTWEEYPKDKYISLERWTPKYKKYTLAKLEEKCKFLSMFNKEQIIYIGSCVPSIAVKYNTDYTYERKNPYKLVDRDYNFRYHPGDGEDAE